MMKGTKGSKGLSPDDMLNSLLKPIEIYEKRYIYMKKRAEMTVLKTLQQIRGRIGFFSIYNLFDNFELEKISATRDRALRNE